MSDPQRQLVAVTYHYVREPVRCRFPRIKGIALDEFRRQIAALSGRFEMATLASALEFLKGRYHPRRDLCLLTFDDGLREHYAEVTPLLAERGIQGVFFLATSCPEGERVLAVHKNHLLMATLEPSAYRAAFETRLAEMAPGTSVAPVGEAARQCYRFDSPEVAEFKYLLNFRLPHELTARVLDSLFAEHLGDEAALARELYLSWNEARAMQDCGMLIGGHSHAHTSLARQGFEEQRADIEACARGLRNRLRDQFLWPFSYPFGSPAEAFNSTTVDLLEHLGFCCAFTTQKGANPSGQDRYGIRRFDTTDIKELGRTR